MSTVIGIDAIPPAGTTTCEGTVTGRSAGPVTERCQVVFTGNTLRAIRTTVTSLSINSGRYTLG